jgi:large subunit ribosomal protein L25
MIGGIIMEILNCNVRNKNTAHDAKKIRRAGKIPGVLYGEKINNMLFEISEMDFNREITAGGEHGVVNVSINGETHQALIKEIQRDPVDHKVLHIDLEDVSSDQMVNSEVPIIFMGEDRLGRNGGILQKEKDSVKVQCKASMLPKHINIDVTGLKYGQTYRIRDIEIAEEISFIEDPNTVIATITGDNTKDTEVNGGETPYPNETKIHNPA